MDTLFHSTGAGYIGAGGNGDGEDHGDGYGTDMGCTDESGFGDGYAHGDGIGGDYLTSDDSDYDDPLRFTFVHLCVLIAITTEVLS